MLLESWNLYRWTALPKYLPSPSVCLLAPADHNHLNNAALSPLGPAMALSHPHNNLGIGFNKYTSLKATGECHSRRRHRKWRLNSFESRDVRVLTQPNGLSQHARKHARTPTIDRAERPTTFHKMRARIRLMENSKCHQSDDPAEWVSGCWGSSSIH